MIAWNQDERRNNKLEIVSTSYVSSIPYLGRVKIHPHIHAPGEWFLTCQALRIDKHPLGSVPPEKAEQLTEAELIKRLEEAGIADKTLLFVFVHCVLISPNASKTAQ